ncbi:hypothetical protein PJW08_00780 (plasmid) [Tenacibaculum finnmarkense]|nr:hypothetical protein PJW08_00780 [Tenacibaculum finnmarkense]
MSGIIFGEYEETRTATERGNSIVIGVFFDGTGNNRKNARARKVATDPLFKLELDKAGNEAKGPFIEMEARFNGIEVFVTARVQTKRWSYGPKDEPYVVMEKPKEPLCKKRWYLLENN